jgi:hypothetical protein
MVALFLQYCIKFPNMLITILWALVYLAIIVGVLYLVLWVFSKLGIAIPSNIINVIWVIVVLLAIIWLVSHFWGGSGGPDFRHVR